jgi:hypothetical protein
MLSESGGTCLDYLSPIKKPSTILTSPSNERLRNTVAAAARMRSPIKATESTNKSTSTNWFGQKVLLLEEKYNFINKIKQNNDNFKH